MLSSPAGAVPCLLWTPGLHGSEAIEASVATAASPPTSAAATENFDSPRVVQTLGLDQHRKCHLGATIGAITGVVH